MVEQNIPQEYKLLSPWAYFGYNILFSIPLVGIICIIIFALDNNNINRRNYARSFLLTMLIVFLIFLFFGLIIGVGIFAIGAANWLKHFKLKCFCMF